jgi:hypothetical protein
MIVEKSFGHHFFVMFLFFFHAVERIHLCVSIVQHRFLSSGLQASTNTPVETAPTSKVLIDFLLSIKSVLQVIFWGS